MFQIFLTLTPNLTVDFSGLGLLHVSGESAEREPFKVDGDCFKEGGRRGNRRLRQTTARTCREDLRCHGDESI